MRKQTVAATLILLAGLAGAANAACLSFEPSQVLLTGTLVSKTFPGPPNYESVKDGDAAETGFYLQLAVPVCAEPAKTDEANDPATNVRLIQLVLDKEGYARLRPKLGQKVALKGGLFSAHSGHHHAELLLTVAK